MFTINTMFARTALTVFFSVGAVVAHANSVSDIQTQLENVKINLQKSVQIAEAYQGGIAYEAELEDDSFTPEYEVKLINNNQRVKITIDAVTGEVKRVRNRD